MFKMKIMSLILACILLAGCNGITVVNQPIQQTSSGSSSAAPESTSSEVTSTPIPEETPTSSVDETPSENTNPIQTASPAPTDKPTPVEINIVAVGDIMCHSAQIKGAYDKETKQYSFDYSFKYIKDIIGQSDLALGNFECTLGGPDKPYSQDKYFNAPDSIIDALKWTGFDVLSTINNHAYDTGSDGLLRTIDIIRSKGLLNVGTRADETEDPFIIEDVKGIKVGIAAYSYETSAAKNAISLNGKPVKSDAEKLVSVFYAGNTTSEVARMSDTVQQMRDAGADIVVFFMHWGNEYQRAPSYQQKSMAQGLADAGVDIIFGSHPHVMQQIETITSENTGRKTVVVYSMGNFISNMREEYMDDPYTEDGMIVNVKVVKDADSNQPVISAVEYLPTWTFMYTEKGLRRYTVVPLDKALLAPKDFGITKTNDVKKAKKSFNNTQNLLEDGVSDGTISVFNPVQ